MTCPMVNTHILQHNSHLFFAIHLFTKCHAAECAVDYWKKCNNLSITIFIASSWLLTLSVPHFY